MSDVPFLDFGSLCKPLAEQLSEQGWTVSDHAALMRFQVQADALSTVAVNNLIPRSQSEKARRKLADKIAAIMMRKADQ